MLSLRFVTSAAMPSKHMFEKIRQSHFEKKDEGARRIQAMLSHFAIEAKRALFISILHMVGWARPD